MTLQKLGYNDIFEKYRIENDLIGFSVGRVIAEHKNNYVIKSETGEFDAKIVGKLRYMSESKINLPSVGDWVAFSEFDVHKALIHVIFPRYSVLGRQEVGKLGEKQIIATNIDYGLIIQSVDRDFSINRLERYLTICYAANVTPIIILNKIDLIDEIELENLLNQLYERVKNVRIFPISNVSHQGLEEINTLLKKGKTYCLLGSSGVGKSTLLNNLVGKGIMKTGAINERSDRGKHITTHRELIVLERGGIMIDNPGMREIGIADTTIGLETTFDGVVKLSKHCKFKNCTHTGEIGCAIEEAFMSNQIDEDSYNNFQKLQKEKTHYNMNELEKKRKDKNLSKIIHNMKKGPLGNKY